jgi:hypothetical protein
MVILISVKLIYGETLVTRLTSITAANPSSHSDEKTSRNIKHKESDAKVVHTPKTHSWNYDYTTRTPYPSPHVFYHEDKDSSDPVCDKEINKDLTK